MRNVVILAAGRGKRLEPLKAQRPKALLEGRGDVVRRCAVRKIGG